MTNKKIKLNFKESVTLMKLLLSIHFNQNYTLQLNNIKTQIDSKHSVIIQHIINQIENGLDIHAALKTIALFLPKKHIYIWDLGVEKNIKETILTLISRYNFEIQIKETINKTTKKIYPSLLSMITIMATATQNHYNHIFYLVTILHILNITLIITINIPIAIEYIIHNESLKKIKSINFIYNKLHLEPLATLKTYNNKLELIRKLHKHFFIYKKVLLQLLHGYTLEKALKSTFNHIDIHTINTFKSKQGTEHWLNYTDNIMQDKVSKVCELLITSLYFWQICNLSLNYLCLIQNNLNIK